MGDKKVKGKPAEMNEMQFVFSVSIGNEKFDIRSYTGGLFSEESMDARPYKHFFTEFHYIFQGSEEITFPHHDKKLVLSAGQICIIRREIYHGVVTSSGIKRFCFNITGDPFPEIAMARVIDSAFIRQIMNHYLKVEPTGDRLGVMLLDVIFELLEIVKRSEKESRERGRLQNRGGREDKQRLQRVRQEPAWVIEEYLLQHFRDPEGLAGLAAQLYLSERQTRNLVKKYYGQEYKTLIIKQRMEFADMLLEDTTRSLEEIAEEVGYRSYSGFYQAYTKYFGISPSDRRQQHMAESNGV